MSRAPVSSYFVFATRIENGCRMDRDAALREPNGRVHPVGLYDLQRSARPVGIACRELVRERHELLPTHSLALSPQAFPPSRQHDPLVRDMVAHARRVNRARHDLPSSHDPARRSPASASKAAPEAADPSGLADGGMTPAEAR